LKHHQPLAASIYARSVQAIDRPILLHGVIDCMGTKVSDSSLVAWHLLAQSFNPQPVTTDARP